jgi:hypothetical protein
VIVAFRHGARLVTVVFRHRGRLVIAAFRHHAPQTAAGHHPSGMTGAWAAPRHPVRMMPGGERTRRLDAMARTRPTFVLAALFSVVSLAACGTSNGSPQSTPPAGTAAPSASADASVAWAQGVCLASADLRASLAQLSAVPSIDPSSAATSADQVRSQVKDQAAAVRQSAASLQTALTALPAGGDPDVVAAQQQLQTAAQRAQQSVAQLGDAAGKVTDSTTAGTLARSLVSLKGALRGTAADVSAYLDSLRASVGSGKAAVHGAFAGAPACAAAAAPATSSSA